jgi:putative transposase
MSIEEYGRLSHSLWECKYHIVFVPKYRKKSFFGLLRKEVGSIFRKLAEQKDCEILEGHVMLDHVHMLISIPPKYAVSSIVGYIKGKSTIYIARHFRGKERNFTGENFWARGYFVSTVGRNEEIIRQGFVASLRFLVKEEVRVYY